MRYVILIWFCCFLLPACTVKTQEVRTLKLAHGLSRTHSVHLGMEYMGNRLDEISGGRMKLEIYPGAQLGSETQCIELLQIGSLDITKVSSGPLEGFVDEFKIFGIPYLMKCKQHMYDVLDGQIGKDLLSRTEPFWFRGLGFYDSGARSFYTVNRPVRKPEDLKGLKIRVMKSPIAVDMMRMFGGSATPVDWGELYTALQSGVVDGAENNTPSVTTAFHHEVAKYFTVNEHTMLPDVLIISLATWNKLSDIEKKWLQQAMDESVVYQRKLWAQQEIQSLEEMKSNGVEIIYPDKKLFMKITQPMIETFKKEEKYCALIEQIQKLGEKYE